MSIRKNNLLLAAFVVVTLVLPALAGSSIGTPVVSDFYTPASDGPSVATIEGLASYVDAWGGVYNAIVSVQNQTHYSYSHLDPFETIVSDQMASDDGYVKQSVFTFTGLSPFPNGAVGPPMAIAEISVSSIVEVPLNRDLASGTDLSISEAITIAEEFVTEYENALGLVMDRLNIIKTNYTYWFEFGVAAAIPVVITTYMMTYVDLLDATPGEAAMSDFRDRLANMGGFMDLADSPDWPDLMTQGVEAFVPSHRLALMGGFESSFVGSLLSSEGKPYHRADASHTDLAETVQFGVVAEVGFGAPGVVMEVSGNETYSLKQHVGHTGNIQNKMAQDTSADSISVIVGAAPGSLTIEGVPVDFPIFDDTFPIPGNVTYGEVLYIPENTPIADAMKMILSAMPREFALMANEGWSQVNMTSIQQSISNGIDYIWGSVTPFPDYKQSILNIDFTTMVPPTPLQELNIDLLAELMNAVGMNPDALTSRVDATLAQSNPLAALAQAFVRYFDSYNLLDILDNDYYADPVALEGYLNTFIDGLEAYLKDFSGTDLPTEFQDKEELAAFVEDHWDIVLQALWTAMAADNLPGIKDALVNMIDMENTREHIIPYLMADLGASWMGGIGFTATANMNEYLNVSQALDVSDLTLTFDASPDSLVIEGPYVVVTKGTSNRTVDSGDIIEFTITVHNYGSETAYDVKVLDGVSSGLDGERDFYWTRATLDPDVSWVISYEVTTTDPGLYSDLPALCVYFNTTLASFDVNDAANWTGSARYTYSAPGYQIQILGGAPNWWEGNILGIPTLYVVAGVGGASVIGVAILLVRRRG
ncbi:MAG: hypothetical protein ACXADO_07865 [Candidatus Thorarchaeota archaeon]|jgi:uncharacterized repeat protein (TIGR01451 family)